MSLSGGIANITEHFTWPDVSDQVPSTPKGTPEVLLGPDENCKKRKRENERKREKKRCKLDVCIRGCEQAAIDYLRQALCDITVQFSGICIAPVSDATVSDATESGDVVMETSDATESGATVSDATVSDATVSDATVSDATVSGDVVMETSGATVSGATESGDVVMETSGATVSGATVSDATESGAIGRNDAVYATGDYDDYYDYGTTVSGDVVMETSDATESGDELNSLYDDVVMETSDATESGVTESGATESGATEFGVTESDATESDATVSSATVSGATVSDATHCNDADYLHGFQQGIDHFEHQGHHSNQGDNHELRYLFGVLTRTHRYHETWLAISDLVRNLVESEDRHNVNGV